MQCLARKSEDWQPEADDEDFETAAKLCFVTGISQGPPDEWNVDGLRPVRHGVDETIISNAVEMVCLSSFVARF